MKRLLQLLPVTGLLLLLMTAVAWADSGSPVLMATGTKSAQTTLVWSYSAGDTIEISLNGIKWDLVSVASSGVRISESVDGNNVVLGLTDSTNYYFRVRHSDGKYSTIADAFPPDEHAHKYFAADTNMCAKCHRTHSATGISLTLSPTIDGVCKTCHAGTGSKYQVDNGRVQGATGLMPTLGGPFGKQLNPAATVNVSSSHMLGATVKTAPGGDPVDQNGKWNAQVGCASCHTAHSSGGYQYRLLRSQMPNMKEANGSTLSSIVVEAYAVTGTSKEYGVYVSGINALCGGCHADYNTSGVASPAHTKNGVYNTNYYRHAVGKDVSTLGLSTTLPLEASSSGAFVSDGTVHTSGTIACVTCHKPHGVTTTSQTGSSSLLIMNNRGVCQDCHKK